MDPKRSTSVDRMMQYTYLPRVSLAASATGNAGSPFTTGRFAERAIRAAATLSAFDFDAPFAFAPFALPACVLTPFALTPFVFARALLDGAFAPFSFAPD